MSLFYKETATVSIEFKQGNRHRVRRVTDGCKQSNRNRVSAIIHSSPHTQKRGRKR